jgi:hypothetical protein
LFWGRETILDQETRRQKQQALMTELIERKIRLHAQHLYEQRGQGEGSALQDWVKAESQVLENSILGPLYRKNRETRLPQVGVGEEVGNPNSQLGASDPSCS